MGSGKKFVSCVVSAVCLVISVAPTYASEKVTVFAAASLTNAITELAGLYKEKAGIDATLSFASSSTLARQIAQGAPADIYLSANNKWMDYVSQQQMIEPETRQSLLTNSLVLVAPKSYSDDKIEVSASWDLSQALQGTRLAVGDPAHVPAGRYAKESLQTLGLWQQAEPLLARANNVRSALVLVERGEAMLGMVYKTDALISKQVKQVAEIPASSHQPIEYPIAIVNAMSRPEVKDFYQFLQSEQALAVFTKYGFGVHQ
ncbi:molybdate ABC transporter substrate-binding protein [Photobacterium lipolyticum]|uniref:Molybdate ABC transporter substrate-binding protein n=1 Tax=Photobacterium lipolyticum TaxID=266810 RepID=A0A2T3MZM0_9GAMM|nr:molybdate ABC transporter substrate-binding protein [Photobacterium lipolyticum]PSW05441.1 molybdate ABC transporter substrate-binding protein [Photobacterium lipolyticum]